MSKGYQIASKKEREALGRFVAEQGEALAPLVELIAAGQMAVDELVAQLGRATLETVLELSAREVAGPAHAGRRGGEVRRHGRQGGVVVMSGQKVRVTKPRLRRRGGGAGAEVPIPAYAAMQHSGGLRERLLGIMMRGVSTRDYEAVIPQMAQRCGVSRSAVSREFAEASADALRQVCEQRFDGVDLLIIYIDGKRFGAHHVIAAVGVDREGNKHVLGLTEGATENAVVVRDLLADLVARGVVPGRKRLFVIDGSKALRAGIDAVYGAENPVQRCRKHKRENVMGYLPREMQRQTSITVAAAWKLEPKAGMGRLEQLAEWLEHTHPRAAASLREGLEETFTINRLGLTTALCRCLATTNVIESTFAGVEHRSGRVTRWRSGEMALRWAAAAGLHTARGFRKIMGYRDLWMLEAALGPDQKRGGPPLDKERMAA